MANNLTQISYKESQMLGEYGGGVGASPSRRVRRKSEVRKAMKQCNIGMVTGRTSLN